MIIMIMIEKIIMTMVNNEELQCLIFEHCLFSTGNSGLVKGFVGFYDSTREERKVLTRNQKQERNGQKLQFSGVFNADNGKMWK